MISICNVYLLCNYIHEKPCITGLGLRHFHGVISSILLFFSLSLELSLWNLVKLLVSSVKKHPVEKLQGVFFYWSYEKF